MPAASTCPGSRISAKLVRMGAHTCKLRGWQRSNVCVYSSSDKLLMSCLWQKRFSRVGCICTTYPLCSHKALLWYI